MTVLADIGGHMGLVMGIRVTRWTDKVRNKAENKWSVCVTNLSFIYLPVYKGPL